MKLNKKEKRRIELYIDMLEFNGDMRSCYSKSVLLKTIKRLYQIKDVNGFYLVSDKPMLRLLEKRFHKHKVIIS